MQKAVEITPGSYVEWTEDQIATGRFGPGIKRTISTPLPGFEPPEEQTIYPRVEEGQLVVWSQHLAQIVSLGEGPPASLCFSPATAGGMKYFMIPAGTVVEWL